MAALACARRKTASGADIAIEERAGSELKIVAGVKIAPEGIAAWNPAFDVTPADLITAIVTDKGVLRPDPSTKTFDVKGFIESVAVGDPSVILDSPLSVVHPLRHLLAVLAVYRHLRHT